VDISKEDLDLGMHIKVLWISYYLLDAEIYLPYCGKVLFFLLPSAIITMLLVQ
jgi:hypothetical protein